MSGDEQPKVTKKDIHIEPHISTEVMKDMPTLAADYMKVMADGDTELCTFIFFRKHILPKLTGQGMTLDGINEEAFLEVKVPYRTAFALTLYMNEVFKEIRKNPDKKQTYFGPGRIEIEQRENVKPS